MKEPTARARIITTSPLAVRVAGDSHDSPIHMVNQAYTPVVGHDVVLLRVGSRWSVAYRFVEA